MKLYVVLKDDICKECYENIDLANAEALENAIKARMMLDNANWSNEAFVTNHPSAEGPSETDRVAKSTEDLKKFNEESEIKLDSLECKTEDAEVN
ncbi:unnamed protein product [Echinostoma caproni]|uniref:RPOLD domain-containing protein n=1 Tax=Echinostoma caproni TaxID=27848 RepID=A0A183AVT5_9TREM|nr:unnamed protein product [Echinostoma caproni]